jgi:hypothetical protein
MGAGTNDAPQGGVGVTPVEAVGYRSDQSR